MGAPDQEENYIGPMARFDLRDELHQQVQATLAEGATLLLGGEKIAVRVTITRQPCWAMSPLR
jgi:succinate-semialdehyde dehydrogenase